MGLSSVPSNRVRGVVVYVIGLSFPKRKDSRVRTLGILGGTQGIGSRNPVRKDPCREGQCSVA